MKKETSLSNRRPAQILIVAGYRLVRETLTVLFEAQRDFEVLHSMGFESEEVSATSEIAPDVAVVYFENDDSIEIMHSIGMRFPSTKIVTVIDSKDVELQILALQKGAVGVVKRDQNFLFLVEAVKGIIKGEVWFNQGLLTQILKKKGERSGRGGPIDAGIKAAALTPRELDVIAMIGEGLKNKLIAERLCISEATVRHHLSTIYGKLDVEDRLNLVIAAYQHNLITINRESVRNPQTVV